MKEKTADLLAAAYEEMLEEYHLSVENLFKLLSVTPLPPKYRKAIRIGAKGGIRGVLLKCAEPRKDQLNEALAIFRMMRTAPHVFRKVLMQTAKELPHARGGPQRKIKLEEERAVCAEIIALRAECDTREAIKRVAGKHGASERTIYRIWGKYYPKRSKTERAPRS
jgi:hypothetical protein